MKAEIPDPTSVDGIRASEENIGIQKLLDAEEYERNRKSQEDLIMQEDLIILY